MIFKTLFYSHFYYYYCDSSLYFFFLFHQNNLKYIICFISYSFFFRHAVVLNIIFLFVEIYIKNATYYDINNTISLENLSIVDNVIFSVNRHFMDGTPYNIRYFMCHYSNNNNNKTNRRRQCFLGTENVINFIKKLHHQGH